MRGSKKSSSVSQFSLMVVLKLEVLFSNGPACLDTVAFIPNDLPILEALRAEVPAGSRRTFNVSLEKAEALYNAVVAYKNSQRYGSASWLAAKSAQVAMNSLHAYQVKAGENARFTLVVNSKPVQA
jgi:hypothetical protein